MEVVVLPIEVENTIIVVRILLLPLFPRPARRPPGGVPQSLIPAHHKSRLPSQEETSPVLLPGEQKT